MTEQAEHQIKIVDLGGAWQRSHPLLQATCTCGWKGKRDFQSNEAAEAEAKRHLDSAETD